MSLQVNGLKRGGENGRGPTPGGGEGGRGFSLEV
jgi:hypothetical protein